MIRISVVIDKPNALFHSTRVKKFGSAPRWRTNHTTNSQSPQQHALWRSPQSLFNKISFTPSPSPRRNLSLNSLYDIIILLLPMSGIDYLESKAKFLDGRGGDVNEWILGWGLLHWACQYEDWEFIVWLVLHRGADINFLTKNYENNALHFTDNDRIIKFLLWRGCDPDHMNDGGKRSWIVRVNHCHLLNLPKILRIILSHPITAIHKDLWREVTWWLVTESDRKGAS